MVSPTVWKRMGRFPKRWAFIVQIVMLQHGVSRFIAARAVHRFIRDGYAG